MLMSILTDLVAPHTLVQMNTKEFDMVKDPVTWFYKASRMWCGHSHVGKYSLQSIDE